MPHPNDAARAVCEVCHEELIRPSKHQGWKHRRSRSSYDHGPVPRVTISEPPRAWRPPRLRPGVDYSELRTLVREETARLRGLTWRKLRRYLSPAHHKVTGPSGASYLIEVQAFWDDPRRSDGDLRVIASGWLQRRQGRGLSEDFIMAPDGSFVGE